MRFPHGTLCASVLLFVGVIASAIASANIPERHSISRLEKILSQSNEKKFGELKKLGPQVYKDLREMTFDENRALRTRWQAFMALVRIGEKESMPEIELALKSREWYLRNAAIRILPLINSDRAYKAALSGLNDSALVVRTAAVDALAEVGRAEAAPKLWNQLYYKENYIRSQSLWIRRHVVEALAKVALPGPDSEDRFVKILDDNDSTLFGPAIKGLERVTGKKLGDPSTPPVYARYFWKKWHKEKFQLKTSRSSSL